MGVDIIDGFPFMLRHSKHSGSFFNNLLGVQGSAFTVCESKPLLSLNFEPGTLNFHAQSHCGLLLDFRLPPSGTIGLFENFFSQANRLRRHFHQLIVGDPLDSLFQPHLPMR